MPRRKLLALSAVLGLSLLCWGNSQAAKPKDEMLQLYGAFVDAVEQVEANYVRPVPRKELLESALRGMLQGLDPHSSYFSDAEWRQFKKQIDGSFSGIGVTVGIDPESGRLEVEAPLVGSPAYTAGIMAGDLIMEVDGKSTENMTSDKAVEIMQGRPGTLITLIVFHPASKKTETLTIRREVIDLPTVVGDRRKPDDTFEYMLDPDKKIGYVRVTSFVQGTVEDLKKVLTELSGRGMKGLVLDLRDDPGGLLSAAVQIADLFVEDGAIVSTEGRNIKKSTYEAEKADPFEALPMAVLINHHSASASEIVAACLQDHKRAAIVGQRSYGKGSVQHILPLDGGDAVLKLTVAAYKRPSGKNIHRFPKAKDADEWGVTPDDGLVLALSEADYANWQKARHDRDQFSGHNPEPKDAKPMLDAQRDKAVEAVRAQIAGAK